MIATKVKAVDSRETFAEGCDISRKMMILFHQKVPNHNLAMRRSPSVSRSLRDGNYPIDHVCIALEDITIKIYVRYRIVRWSQNLILENESIWPLRQRSHPHRC